MNEFMMLIMVPYGYAKKVVKSANIAGADGATIIRARGADRLFDISFLGFKIEPEGELVLIMASKDILDLVCSRIKQDLGNCLDCSAYILPSLCIDFNKE